MKLLKSGGALVAATLSALYLANVGAGVVELIPDNIPVAGNLDEFIASLILIRSLAYLGLSPPLGEQAYRRDFPIKYSNPFSTPKIKC
jgi:hypothetical protein